MANDRSAVQRSLLRPLGFAFSYDPTGRATQGKQGSGLKGFSVQCSGFRFQVSAQPPAKKRPG